MGLFGLSAKEKLIWDNISSGDQARVFLEKKGLNPFKAKVLRVDEDSIYLETPAAGDVYLELPRKIRVLVEIEMYTLQRGKAKFSSWVRCQEWLRESSIKIACPKRIKWLDSRRSYRLGVSLAAEFSFVDTEKAAGDLTIGVSANQAEVKNISEGGALIISGELSSVNIGDFINIKINLTGENFWRARAQIIHIELGQKYGLGVEWVSLKKGQITGLKNFITAKIGKETGL